MPGHVFATCAQQGPIARDAMAGSLFNFQFTAKSRLLSTYSYNTRLYSGILLLFAIDTDIILNIILL